MPKGKGGEEETTVGSVKVDVLNADTLKAFAGIIGDAIQASNDRQAAAIAKLAGAVQELADGHNAIRGQITGIVGSLRSQTKTIARANLDARKRGDEMMENARKVSGSDPDPSR